MGDDFEYLRHMKIDGGQDEIFHALMDRYGKDVWNFAYSLTCRKEVADDITQNTFLQVYRHMGSFQGNAAYKTWILAIARNQIVDYRRSAFYRKVYVVPDVFRKFMNLQTHPSAEKKALDNMAANKVWETVLQLPAKFREVLLLYAHHQLSVREIAELLSISEGTVKSRLSRARDKVKKLLEGE